MLSLQEKWPLVKGIFSHKNVKTGHKSIFATEKFPSCKVVNGLTAKSLL